MFKHLFLVVTLGWALTAAAEYDNFHAESGGNAPESKITTITITIIQLPTVEEITRLCSSTTPAAGCYRKDSKGNAVIIIPVAGGWDDYYHLCIAGHELYHAMGANHATGMGCPYPIEDRKEVEKKTKKKTTKRK